MKLKILILIFISFIAISTSQESLSPSEKSDIVVAVDGEYPIIIILNPENISYNNATPILLNYTIMEISLDSIWYSLNNQQNITISAPIYLSLPEGDYFLRLYANDSFNRVNFSEIQFNVNNSIPSCGDAICDIEESCSNCPIDCGQCPSQDKGSSGGASASSEIPEIKKINETQPLSGENISYDEEKKSNISSGKIPEIIKINYQTLFYLIISIIILIIVIFIIIHKPKKKEKYKNESRRN